MKKRLKEMEEEAAALREMQAKVEKEMGAVQGCVIYFVRVLCVFISVSMFAHSDFVDLVI